MVQNIYNRIAHHYNVLRVETLPDTLLFVFRSIYVDYVRKMVE